MSMFSEAVNDCLCRWAVMNVRWRPNWSDSGVHLLTGLFLHTLCKKKIKKCGQQVVKQKGKLFGQIPMRTITEDLLLGFQRVTGLWGIVDVLTIAISTHKEREPLAMQNMITCMCVWVLELIPSVCVYLSCSFILIALWKPWWKCVRMCGYWSSSSRGRLGYLSSHGVLQPKHTFFCLGLGCAYQSSKNTQPRVLSEFSEWKITHCKEPSTWQELHCEQGCFTKKKLDNFECHTDGN